MKTAPIREIVLAPGYPSTTVPKETLLAMQARFDKQLEESPPGPRRCVTFRAIRRLFGGR